jgi:hypothetical protein
LIQVDPFSSTMQSSLVDMFVGAIKVVVTTINFTCTASWPMKMMLFTLANLSPTEIIYLHQGLRKSDADFHIVHVEYFCIYIVISFIVLVFFLFKISILIYKVYVL